MLESLGSPIGSHRQFVELRFFDLLFYAWLLALPHEFARVCGFHFGECGSPVDQLIGVSLIVLEQSRYETSLR